MVSRAGTRASPPIYRMTYPTGPVVTGCGCEHAIRTRSAFMSHSVPALGTGLARRRLPQLATRGGRRSRPSTSRRHPSWLRRLARRQAGPE